MSSLDVKNLFTIVLVYFTTDLIFNNVFKELPALHSSKHFSA